YIEALIKRANFRADLEDHEGAMYDYTIALKIDSMNTEADFIRGYSEGMLGASVDAMDDCTKEIVLEPDDVDAYFIRGDTYRILKEFNKSLNDYNSVLKLDSLNGKAYFKRGMAELELKKNKDACADLVKAGKLGYVDAYEQIQKHCVKKKKK